MKIKLSNISDQEAVEKGLDFDGDIRVYISEGGLNILCLNMDIS